MENFGKKKTNVFVGIGHAFMNFFSDFFKSFKYNKCKLAGYLIATTGVVIGFFLQIHYESAMHFQVVSDEVVNLWTELSGGELILKKEVDYSGLYMFGMVLCGCVNIFNGVSLMKKKNLGTVITSGLISVLIVFFGVMWIQCFYHTQYLVTTIPTGYSIPYVNLSTPYNIFNGNGIMSMVCVYIAMITSVLGTVLGFINRNKNYKKEIV